MTAENDNEVFLHEGQDQPNLNIQGNADDSNIAVGDRNTIHQGPSYYTTHVFGPFGAQQRTERLKHLRRQLLQQMKTNVAKRLEDSLHNLLRIDLEQEEQRHQVGRRRKESLVEISPNATQVSHELVRRELALSNSNESREPISSAEQTYKIFYRADIGGRLLILGEPGSGKTTELLTVAQQLVDIAIQDETQPIPLIFELSSWTPNTPVLSWLGQQLKKSYGVSQKLTALLTQALIQQSQLLPLLDGLDELGQQNQVACIKALESFLGQHPALPAIICCRREEYEQGGEKLKQLNGAIYLQEVEPRQIQQYLHDLGRAQLWEGIQAAPELLMLAQSPLFLTMLVVAYQGQPISNKTALLNAYLQKQLNDPKNKGAYKPGKGKTTKQVLHYLGWLAQQLEEENETEFLIEYLQPGWLMTEEAILMDGFNVGGLQERWLQLYVALLGLLVGVCIFILCWLGDNPAMGLLYGLLLGAITWIINTLNPTIRLIEKIDWSIRNSLFFGILGGLIVWLLLGWKNAIVIGLLISLFSAIYTGLLHGFLEPNTSTIDKKQVPNQGIKQSFQNGAIIAILGGGLCGIFITLGMLGENMRGGLLGGIDWLWEPWKDGPQASNEPWVSLIFILFIAIVLGCPFGLLAAIQHFVLRSVLVINGSAPWNYERFLEYAVDHRFIQRTGGRYRFVHDLLRQHFAQMTQQQQALLAQPNED